jgi:uncharacterized membrane protein YgcG
MDIWRSSLGWPELMRHLDRRSATVGDVSGKRVAFPQFGRRGRFRVILLTLAVVGCAHDELNSNTVDIANTIESLYKEQALNNLSRLIDEPRTLPSQVDISNGSVQTSEQLNGTGTFPLGNQVVNGGMFTVTQITAAARQLMLGSQFNRQQSWSITPLTDPASLQRLRAVYNHVINRPLCSKLADWRYCIGPKDYKPVEIGHDNTDAELNKMYDQKLKEDYELNIIATNNNMVVDSSRLMRPTCVICAEEREIQLYQNQKNEQELEKLKTLVVHADKFFTRARDFSQDHPKTPDKTTNDVDALAQSVMQTVLQQVIGEFHQMPNNDSQLVLNTSDDKTSKPYKSPILLNAEINNKLKSHWLYWSNDATSVATVQALAPENLPPDPTNVHYLGHYGNHQLMMTRTAYDSGVLADFLLFLLPQADPRLPAPPTSGGGGGGSGGGSGGGGSSGASSSGSGKSH